MTRTKHRWVRVATASLLVPVFGSMVGGNGLLASPSRKTAAARTRISSRLAADSDRGLLLEGLGGGEEAAAVADVVGEGSASGAPAFRANDLSGLPPDWDGGERRVGDGEQGKREQVDRGAGPGDDQQDRSGHGTRSQGPRLLGNLPLVAGPKTSAPGRAPAGLGGAALGAAQGQGRSDQENGGGPKGMLVSVNKNALRPNVLVQPKGSGAVKGMGVTFRPDLQTGAAGAGLSFRLPPGRAGLGPQVGVGYSSSTGQGICGMGWSLQAPFISRQLDRGLARYDDSVDRFVFAGSSWMWMATASATSMRRIPRWGNWEPIS